mgnify:CR=1 FL=1
MAFTWTDHPWVGTIGLVSFVLFIASLTGSMTCGTIIVSDLAKQHDVYNQRQDLPGRDTRQGQHGRQALGEESRYAPTRWGSCTQNANNLSKTP